MGIFGNSKIYGGEGRIDGGAERNKHYLRESYKFVQQ